MKKCGMPGLRESRQNSQKGSYQICDGDLSIGHSNFMLGKANLVN